MYEKYMRNNENFYHMRMHLIVHDVRVNKFQRQNYSLSHRSKEYSIILNWILLKSGLKFRYYDNYLLSIYYLR